MVGTRPLRPVVAFLVVLSGCLGPTEGIQPSTDPIGVSGGVAPLPEPILDRQRVEFGMDPFNHAQQGICSQSVSTCFRYPFNLSRGAVIRVDLTWSEERNDFDAYLFTTSGTEIARGANEVQGGTTNSEAIEATVVADSYEIVIVVWLVVQDTYALRVLFEEMPPSAPARLPRIGVSPLPGIPGRVVHDGCRAAFSFFYVPPSVVEPLMPPGFRSVPPVSNALLPTLPLASFGVAAISCAGSSAGETRFAEFDEAWVWLTAEPPPELAQNEFHGIVLSWRTASEAWDAVLAAWNATGRGPVDVEWAVPPHDATRQVSIAGKGFELEIAMEDSPDEPIVTNPHWRFFFTSERRVVGAIDWIGHGEFGGISATSMVSQGNTEDFMGAHLPAGAGNGAFSVKDDTGFDIQYVPLDSLTQPPDS